MVINHVKALRNDPWTCGATVFFVTESNSGLEAGHVAVWLEDYDWVHCYRRTDEAAWGLRTDRLTKVYFGYALYDAVAADSVQFLDTMICTTPPSGERDGTKYFMNLLRDQARNYRKMLTPATKEITMSGKKLPNGESTNMNDDAIFCLTGVIGTCKKVQQRELKGAPYDVLSRNSVF
jgi:hypothetical protein